MAGEWPLVGRGAELTLLGGLVRSGERRGVVLAGPAGVGKTRLACECLAEADQAGLPTARVAATRSAAHLPFGALAALLPPTELSVGVENQAAYLRRCCDTITERAGDQRLMLLVDDAHLLDDASATLIHQLAQSGSAFVLATLRSGEAAPDAVAALWKDDLAERIDLGGLSADAIEDLLAAVLGGPVDRAAVSRLAGHSQGNVLFLRELILGALGAGTLREDGGVWHLAGSLATTDRLVELVESRLAGLDDAERALLELVAFAEPLGTAEISALADPSLAESLERQDLLVSRSDGRRLDVRQGHHLFGDVLRARLPAIRSRALARAMADAVEATGARRREDVLRVATWRLDGGGQVRADLMLAAAHQARARFALSLAERLSRAAVDAGAGFEAGVLVGQICHLQGRGEDAERELAALVDQAADDRQRVLLVITRMGNLAWGLGRLDDALRAGAEAEATIRDPACRDAVTPQRGGLLVVSGQTTTALELLEPLVSRADGATLVYACLWAAYALGLVGRLDAAIDVSQRGRAAHLALIGPPITWRPHVHVATQGFALSFAGRLKESEEVADAEYTRGIAEGDVEVQRLLGWQLASTLLVRGRVTTAVRLARESATLFRGTLALLLRSVLITLAHGLAMAGAPDEARKTLAELDGLGLSSTHFWGTELLRARAWTAVAEGDLAAGRRLLDEAVTLAHGSGDKVLESAALHDLARLGQAPVVAGRLEELAEGIDGDLAPSRATHARALADGNAVALEQASAAFEAMGADLLGAEAAVDAGVVWRRAGNLDRAATVEARARLLATRCEGAVTPALRAFESQAALAPDEQGLPSKSTVSAVPARRRARRTFMFTDIVRSTNLVETLGDEAWEHLLRWHDHTLRTLFAGNQGEEINRIGDGFFVAFERAEDGVRCAMQIQRGLESHRIEHGFAPLIRIGLHEAEATREGADYQGRGVHEAARIAALAQGGEILASGVVVENVPDLVLSVPRSAMLKGLSEPVEVVSIGWK